MSTDLQTTDASPVALIRHALETNADPQYLRELLAVRREWEADEARKAFFFAVSEFQRRAPIIEKADKAYGKEYARLDRIWREIRPLLTDLGLSVTWQATTLSAGVCRVEGVLAHRQGHSVQLVHDLPLPDMVKGQNAAQQMGSAETYSRRYALCSALGIVTGDDDDGASAGTPLLTVEQVEELEQLIAKTDDLTARDDLLAWAGVGSVSEIPQAKHKTAVRSLQARIK